MSYYNTSYRLVYISFAINVFSDVLPFNAEPRYSALIVKQYRWFSIGCRNKTNIRIFALKVIKISDKKTLKTNDKDRRRLTFNIKLDYKCENYQ